MYNLNALHFLFFFMGIAVVLLMQFNYYLRNGKHLFEWSKYLGWHIVYEPRDKRKHYKTRKVFKIVKRKEL